MKNIKIYKKVKDLFKKKNNDYSVDSALDNLNGMDMDDYTGIRNINISNRVKDVLSNGFSLVKDFGLQVGSKSKELFNKTYSNIVGNNLNPIQYEERRKLFKRGFAIVLVGTVLTTSTSIITKSISNNVFVNNNSHSMSDTDLDSDITSDTVLKNNGNKKEVDDTPVKEDKKLENKSIDEKEETPDAASDVKKDTEDKSVEEDKNTPDLPVKEDKNTQDTPIKDNTNPKIVDIPLETSFDEYSDLYEQLTSNNNETDDSIDVVVDESLNQEINDNNILNDAVEDEYEINDIQLGSKITIKDGSKIYDDVYDSSYENNELDPYFSGDIERIVLCIAFEHEGQLVYCDIHDDNAQEKIDYLKSNGAKVMSVITSVDGENYEGAYNINSVSKVLVKENNKQLVKM